MADPTLELKMRVALEGLLKTVPLLVSTIDELRKQNFSTEAGDLQTVLDSLKTEIDTIIAAVNS